MRILPKIPFTLVACLFLTGWLPWTKAANILVYGAVGSHSIRLSMLPLMETLVEGGHNITYLSAYDNFEDPHQKSNITYITPPKWKEAFGPWENHLKFFDIRKTGRIPQSWLGVLDLGVLSCQVLYSDPEFVSWVKSSPKYDLIIMEGLVNECALGLVHLYQSRLIVYGTTAAFPWFTEAYGFPDETSTIPELIFDFPGGERMTFLDRVKNALVPIVFRLKKEYFYFPALEEITRQGLGLREEELPSFLEIEKTTSLVFMTTHVTVDLPRSLPPHVIPIGGAVLNKKPKPLSKDVEKFISSASKGFLYISFGTIAEFANFDREVQLEFIKALGSFPETKFLWRISSDMNDTVPKNVMLTKWVPQQTVLGHPNIKGYVSHCGMGSVTEAVHFAVPMVLVPVLAEQDANANVMESRGVGVKVEITTLKRGELEHAISEILNNDRYKIAMKTLSTAFKDRAVKPLDDAVWWIEYILRHDNSNDYLVPLSVHQSWWKRRQLDVWLFLGALLFLCVSLTLVMLFFAGKTISRMFRPKEQPPKMKAQ